MVEQQTVQTSTPPAKQDHLGRVLFTLAVIALALAPTQLRMVVKGIPLSPVEPILALAILVWAVRWFFIRDTRSLPPLTHWVIVLSVALGIFALHDSLVQAAQGAPPEDPIWKVNFINEFAKPFIKKELAQVILYLIVAATVFRAAFTTPQRIRIAAIALLATTTLAIGLGVVQRVQLARQYEPDPSKRLVFANHYDRMDEEVKKQLSKKEKDRLERVMGVWDGQNFTPCSSAKAYLTAQKPEAVCSTFAAWAEHGYYPSRTAYAGFLALVLPFALVLMATSRRRPGIIAWMGVLLVGAAVSVLAGYVLPAIGLGLIATGVALGRPAGRNVILGLFAFGILVLIVGGMTKKELLVEPYTLQISQEEANIRYDDGVRHLKKFWGEQQAALNLARSSPLLGMGAGTYQSKISSGYDAFAVLETQRLEPDAQNGYLLTLVEQGVVGLIALLALFGVALMDIRRRLREEPGNPWAAALLGALVALIILTFVTNPWVRGTSLMVVAVLSMIGNIASFPTVGHTDQEKESV